ncbi:unnamed protein product [Rotaria sp. Silwood2]|nr:unnamed protein product [Rotaria sp. Silwood2]CAF4396205.1 unnamed protein product [Rotaria sp. Silwood2]
MSTYINLQEHYSNTLQCPCAHMSITNNEFIMFLNATYHPICSSNNFVNKWFNYFFIYQDGRAWWLNVNDFRYWSILFFNFLEKYCKLANSTVNNAIEQFNLVSFVSSEVMSPILFKTQVDMTINLLQKSILILFARQLQMFRGVIQGNGLISSLETSMEFKVDQIAVDAPVFVIPKTYNNGTCSCATSSTCVELASFYNVTHHTVYTIENIFIGCFLIESILHSSLSCFFSNSCMTDLMKATILGIPGPNWQPRMIDISPLQFSSSTSNFRINDTIETMVYQLFIDFWSSEISYERYYNACAPTHCTYSYEKRLDVLYAVTIFLTVINGLSLGLRFVVPIFVRLVYKLRNRLCGYYE